VRENRTHGSIGGRWRGGRARTRAMKRQPCARSITPIPDQRPASLGGVPGRLTRKIGGSSVKHRYELHPSPRVVQKAGALCTLRSAAPAPVIDRMEVQAGTRAVLAGTRAVLAGTRAALGGTRAAMAGTAGDIQAAPYGLLCRQPGDRPQHSHPRYRRRQEQHPSPQPC